MRFVVFCHLSLSSVGKYVAQRELNCCELISTHIQCKWTHLKWKVTDREMRKNIATESYKSCLLVSFAVQKIWRASLASAIPHAQFNIQNLNKFFFAFKWNSMPYLYLYLISVESPHLGHVQNGSTGFLKVFWNLGEVLTLLWWTLCWRRTIQLIRKITTFMDTYCEAQKEEEKI